MTSSRSETRAGDALERTFALLDETRVRNAIDEPIDAAATAFLFQEESPV